MAAAVPDHATLLPGVPLSDTEAWNAYSEWRWIYHKTEVVAAQGVPCGVMPDEPTSYPVVLKPITNMYGMGWQAYILKSRSDYQKHWGHTGMWMPLCEGPHRSIDLLLDRDGNVVWWTCFEGELTRTFGAFSEWRWTHQSDPGAHSVVDLFARTLLPRLAGYHGCICFESIGDTIIEAHLRPGDMLALWHDQEWLAELRSWLAGERRWSLGVEYRPATEVRGLLPIWWPASLAWPLETEEVLRRCSPAVVAVFDKCPGATVGGKKRPLLLYCRSLEEGRADRQRLFRDATLQLLQETDNADDDTPTPPR